VFRARVGAIGADFAHFDWREARGAGGVIFGQRVGVPVLGLPDKVEIGFQRGYSSGISTSFAPRQRRSRP
jgi:hypothetical protein